MGTDSGIGAKPSPPAEKNALVFKPNPKGTTGGYSKAELESLPLQWFLPLDLFSG